MSSTFVQPLSSYPAGILSPPLRPLIIPSQAAPRKAFQCIFPDRVKRAIGDNIIPAAYLYSVSLAHSFVGEGDLLILLPHIPSTHIYTTGTTQYPSDDHTFLPSYHVQVCQLHQLQSVQSLSIESPTNPTSIWQTTDLILSNGSTFPCLLDDMFLDQVNLLVYPAVVAEEKDGEVRR